MDSVILVRALSALLLPPLNLILLAALGGLLLRFGYRRGGGALIALSLIVLAALSTPIVAHGLLGRVQAHVHALTPAAAVQTQAQAIVILGGGRLANAPEYGGMDQPGSNTLGRIRYGARLHTQTGLPILVTGGSPERRTESEAALMRRSLREDFKLPVRWEEGESDNTEQNARNSARILKQAGVKRILLVSDAWHLPRATPMFRDQGLEVVPAPTNFILEPAMPALQAWLPQAPALNLSWLALHEWIGMAWYALRH